MANKVKTTLNKGKQNVGLFSPITKDLAEMCLDVRLWTPMHWCNDNSTHRSRSKNNNNNNDNIFWSPTADWRFWKLLHCRVIDLKLIRLNRRSASCLVPPNFLCLSNTFADKHFTPPPSSSLPPAWFIISVFPCQQSSNNPQSVCLCVCACACTRMCFMFFFIIGSAAHPTRICLDKQSDIPRLGTQRW